MAKYSPCLGDLLGGQTDRDEAGGVGDRLVHPQQADVVLVESGHEVLVVDDLLHIPAVSVKLKGDFNPIQ